MTVQADDRSGSARPRLQHLDVLRALALIAVLAGHVWYVGWPNRLIYAWHVPLFFVLAGLLWRPGRSVRAELKHRWPVLVVPYVAWWLLVLAVAIGYLLIEGESVSPFWVILSAWGGAAALRPFTAFWFFSAFLVALLVLRLLERFPRWVSYAVAVAAIATCLADSWLMRRLPLAIGTGVGCTFFVLVGQDLARLTSRRRAGWWGAAGLVAGFGLVVMPGYRPLELKHAVYGTPVMSVVAGSLIACGLVLVAPAVTARIPAWAVASCTWLSALSVPVMLGQGIFLMVLQTPFTGRWSDFVVATLGSVGLAWLLRKSPVGDWFCGPAASARTAVSRQP